MKKTGLLQLLSFVQVLTWSMKLSMIYNSYIKDQKDADLGKYMKERGTPSSFKEASGKRDPLCAEQTKAEKTTIYTP